jgi:hypothetical protein
VPAQRRLTRQVVRNHAPFIDLRQANQHTRAGEQRRLQTSQKYRAVADASVLGERWSFSSPKPQRLPCAHAHGCCRAPSDRTNSPWRPGAGVGARWLPRAAPHRRCSGRNRPSGQMHVAWAISGSRARTRGAAVADGAFKSWLHWDERCVMDKKPWRMNNQDCQDFESVPTP